jgi:hypothetical protein
VIQGASPRGVCVAILITGRSRAPCWPQHLPACGTTSLSRQPASRPCSLSASARPTRQPQRLLLARKRASPPQRRTGLPLAPLLVFGCERTQARRHAAARSPHQPCVSRIATLWRALLCAVAASCKLLAAAYALSSLEHFSRAEHACWATLGRCAVIEGILYAC